MKISLFTSMHQTYRF